MGSARSKERSVASPAESGRVSGGTVVQEPSPPWHRQPAQEVLAGLESGSEGLSAQEAAHRLRRYGPNVLSTVRRVPWWRILVRQLESLIVALLAVAAVGAFLVGDHLEGLAVVAVLAINTAIGFSMETWAQRAMESLRRLEVQQARVRRGGEVRTIDARELVPGDVILIETGEAIPADARLLSAQELETVEAPLTGESIPVAKSVAAMSEREDGEIPLAERAAMVYKGTIVAVGTGEAAVVATGGETEIGRIAELVVETEETESPLEGRLRVLGRRLAYLSIGIAALVTLSGALQGRDLWLMIETGIALAIAAVPEGLPVVATITLGLGMRRMAKRRALVRRLPAVETLGSATLVCADKTGTLTAGEMTATRYLLSGRTIRVGGVGHDLKGAFREGEEELAPLADTDLSLALEIGMLTNRGTLSETDSGIEAAGDPTDVALLVAARKAELELSRLREDLPQVAEVPFSSERMLMATFHRRGEDGEIVGYVKGSPQRLLELSVSVWRDGEAVELDGEIRERLERENLELAGEGLRVLALAFRSLDEGEKPGADALRDLVFLGLVGISDPPAEGVEETIRDLEVAGIRTVMITGDQAQTAAAVGRELGLFHEGDEVVEGSALAKGDEELERSVVKASVFSRVSPRDKLRIVRAFQAGGEVVAMLGDGVNDAPALKQADIGVAMGGRGTDVAKETADLVLRDDRFETIVVAVEEGRVIFDNIRKFVFYLFSCNLSEVLVLMLASLAGLPLPLLPLQILWLNLITDVFPALALAAEPADDDVMTRPPREPEVAILSRGFLITTASYALVLTATTMGSFLWSLEVLELDDRHAGTIAFMTLALAQLVHVFNARSPDPVVLSRRLFTNPWVWGALVLTVILQLAAVYQPTLSTVLATHALSARDWLLVLAATGVPLVVGEAWKTIHGRRRG